MSDKTAKGLFHHVDFNDRGFGFFFEQVSASDPDSLLRHAHTITESLVQVTMSARLVAEGVGGGDDELEPTRLHGLLVAVELMGSMATALLEEVLYQTRGHGRAVAAGAPNG